MRYLRCRWHNIRDGFKNIWRHFSMSLSAIITVALTLMMVGVFFVLSLNISNITQNIEDSLQMHIKIERTVEEDAIANISRQIMAIDGVETIELSTKDEELDKLIDSYGEQGKLFEMYVGERNPLRDAFLITFDNSVELPVIASQVENIEGIEAVNYGGEGTTQLIDMIKGMQKIILVIVMFLGIIAIFLIANAVKAAIIGRNAELKIMKNIGATNGYIRAPFLIEGALLGVLGSIIPIGIICGGYVYIYKELGGHLFTTMFPLIEANPFINDVAFILLGAGVIVGIIGSYLSVTKYLWWIR